jgi:hypothetical protein
LKIIDVSDGHCSEQSKATILYANQRPFKNGSQAYTVIDQTGNRNGIFV